MSLIVDLSITDTPWTTTRVDQIIIRRLEPLTNRDSPQDEVHGYEVTSSDRKPITVHHRYGDGARELLRIALNALEETP